ncbi:MAG: hypothetical protein II859_14000, partial [Bacteroidales bacterium]|nr:hypothetical protein [Bacteroidales bacterium]
MSSAQGDGLTTTATNTHTAHTAKNQARPTNTRHRQPVTAQHGHTWQRGNEWRGNRCKFFPRPHTGGWHPISPGINTL